MVKGDRQSNTSAQGYAEQANELIERYEAISFDELFKPVSHLFPMVSADILDIGAGTGRDAAAFAKMGHRVIAVEPTLPFLVAAKTLHPSAHIEWIADSLPDLAKVQPPREGFDMIMLTAVWMHLDTEERARGMTTLKQLLKDGGQIMFTLRHGPVPHGRRMFEVSANETVQLASKFGMFELLRLRQNSLQRSNQVKNVTWTRLVLQSSN